MANRVLLGQRGAGQYGLYVSKPGDNVLTAPDADLLFSSDRDTWQFVLSGQISIANNSSGTITYPNLGYNPCLLVLPNINPPVSSGGGWTFDVNVTYLSNTSASIAVTITDWNYLGVCTYAVLRSRYDG